MFSLIDAYIGALVLSTLGTVSAAAIAWRMIPQKMAPVTLTCAALWAIAALVSVVYPDESVALVAYKLRFNALVVSVLSLFLLVCSQTARAQWTQGWRLALTSLVPTTTILLTWLPGGWVFPGYSLVEVGGARIFSPAAAGPWFWVHVVFSYGAILACTVLLVFWSERTLSRYRIQLLALSATIGVILVANIVPVSHWFETPTMDWSAASFWIGAPVWIWLILRHGGTPRLQLLARDTLLQVLDDAVAVIDSRGEVIETNPGFERTRSAAGHSAIDALLRDVVRSSRHDPSGAASRYERALSTPAGERHFEIDVSPAQSNHAGTANLCVIRDVTETVKLIAALEAYDRMVAHDLRNPVSGTISLLDLADLTAQQGEGFAAEIEAAKATCEKAVEIVQAHLRLAGFRRGVSPQRVAIDSRRIIEGVLRRYAHQVARAKAEIAVDVGQPCVLGDPALVEQVWANYLSNALRHAGDQPKIRLGSEELSAQEACFWVEDNGPGLDESTRERVFEGDPGLTSATRGHGIGLTIVRQIVERLGGRVGVDSVASGGSRFWFTLPST